MENYNKADDLARAADVLLQKARDMFLEAHDLISQEEAKHSLPSPAQHRAVRYSQTGWACQKAVEVFDGAEP